MFRFIFLLSILTAINAIAQETEIKNWIQYFDKHQKEKTPISKSYYAKEDFTVPDTSHILRDVLFLGRIYVGTYGQEYNRMLAFFQATKKINDSIYSFKAFFKQLSSATTLNGKAELKAAFEIKTLNPIDTIIEHIQLWKLSIVDTNNDSLFIGWFTCEMDLYTSSKKKFLQYLWPASFPEVSFQNIIVAKFRTKSKRPWQLLQLVPNTYLMHFLPKNDFLEFTKEESSYSDFPMCRIKQPYLKKGWNFTKGEWITTRYSVEKVFGYKWIPF